MAMNVDMYTFETPEVKPLNQKTDTLSISNEPVDKETTGWREAVKKY